MKKVFLAGATGFTGQAVLKQSSDLEFVIPVRKGSPRLADWQDDPRLRVVDYADEDALAAAMEGCRGVLCVVGTTRAQFSPGVSYETVDYAVPVKLLAAARKVGASHFVLMSSMGAGRPFGAYLKWKARAEKAVMESGIPYTIVRPAYLLGEGRPYPRSIIVLGDLAGWLPGLDGAMRDVRAIPIEVLAWNFVRILSGGEDLGVLRGRDLWRAWAAR